MKTRKALKKSMVLTLTATMGMGGLLSGCGSKDNADDVVSITTEDNTANEETGEKKVVRIVRDCGNLTTSDDEEVKKIQDAINEYISDKIDVQIELKEISSGEYIDKVNLALGNNEFDLFWTASWRGAINCESLVKGNGVYDLTDIVKDSVLYTTMPENVWEAAAFDGKYYFIPNYKEVAEGYDLMFRKDLIDEFGWDLSTVKELKDIEPMLQDCLEAGVEAPFLTQAGAVGWKFMMDEYSWICEYDFIGIDRETNEVVSVFETEDYRDYCEMMCEWGEKGYIQEGDVTNSNPSSALYSQFWGISWWTDVPDNASASTRYKQDVEMVHMTGNYIDSNTTLGSCWAVCSTVSDETAQACVDFMGLLYSDEELADYFVYGIEGTDYERNEDGKIVKMGELFDHSTWQNANVMCVSLEENEPDNKTELYEAFNEAAKVSITSGFRFDTTPVEAELAAVKSVVDQYGIVIENGGFASDRVDEVLAEYKEAMYEAGYEKVYQEVKDQYDAWKSAQ